MKKYNRYEIDESITNVCVCGDLHGLFKTLLYKIKQKGITNTLIIIAGDCGFGFEKIDYYKQIHNKMVKTLKKNNVKIIFIRGNHDDKSLFDGEKINYKNFIAVPDYSVITVNIDGKKSNILCVGGAISVDRTYRIHNESLTKKQSYWVDEKPIYEDDVLDDIKNDGIGISAVVTHTSPSFAPLQSKNGIESWLEIDAELHKDIDYERETLTKLYNHIVIKDEHPVNIWLYGHFHKHETYQSNENVKFVMLDCFNENKNYFDIFELYNFL